MVKQIVSAANGRLGMRLCTLMNVVRLSRKFGFDYGISWPKYFDFEINNYADIFSSEFIEKHFMDEVPSKFYRRPALRGLTLSSRDIETMQSGAAGYVFTSPLPLLLEGEEVADVEPLFPECFADLDFSPAVRDMIAAARKAMAGSDFIAMHVRRGDLLSDLHRDNDWAKKKYVPVAVYEAYVAARADSNRFLIFSDSPHVIEEMTARFPHVQSADSIVPAAGLTDLQVALRDIILISLSKNVVAAAVSGFSTAGAMIGGHQILDIAEIVNEDEQLAALQALYDRFDPAGASALPVARKYELAQDISYYARMLDERDRAPEAAAALEQAIRLDPTNIGILITQSRVACTAGAFDLAQAAILAATDEVERRFVNARLLNHFIVCAMSTGLDFAYSRAEGLDAPGLMRRVIPIGERNELFVGSRPWQLAIAHLIVGDTAAATVWIDKTAEMPEKNRVSNLNRIAMAAIRFGNQDMAKVVLERMEQADAASAAVRNLTARLRV